MYFGFVGGLILFTYVLQLVLAIVAIPIALLVALFTRGREQGHDYHSALFTQVLVCIVTGGMLALLTTTFLDNNGVSFKWPYFLTAFVSAFLTLGQNTIEKERHARSLEQMFTPGAQGAAAGALWGFYAGIAFFVIASVWPQVIALVPGAAFVIALTLVAGAWLFQFWLVRLLVGVTALGYLLNMAFVVLMGGAALWGALSREKP